jgi:imidazolonepropionase-like amidohydrolase
MMKTMKKMALTFTGILLMGLCTVISAQQNFLVIMGGSLIDGTGKPPVEDAVILIQGGKFQAVGKKGEVKIPEGARIIDVRGKTVVPGLIDAHFHMCYPNTREQPFVLDESIASFRAAYHLRRHLMGGITTILDAGAYKNVSVMAKRAFSEGLLLGSRPIIVAERINATGGHGVSRFPMAYEADGPDEFRKAVRLQIKKGADVIKILPPYTKEEIAAAIDEAHMLKKTVAVHSGYLGNYDYIRWAVELGSDIIMHAYALTDDIILDMGKKGIYGVPTMTIMMKLHATRGIHIPEDRPHEYEIIFQKMKAAGVKMVVGTDAIYEFMNENPGLYFEEVERFVKNGYTPHEAIIAATRIGAEVLAAADLLGTIEKGKIADMLVLDGDPLADIRNLRHVSVIIQGGKVIKDQ